MNACGDELTLIRSNGKHPQCELQQGHAGDHEVTTETGRHMWGPHPDGHWTNVTVRRSTQSSAKNWVLRLFGK